MWTKNLVLKSTGEVDDGTPGQHLEKHNVWAHLWHGFHDGHSLMLSKSRWQGCAKLKKIDAR